MAAKKFLAVLLCAAVLVTICQAQDEESCDKDACELEIELNEQYKRDEELLRARIKRTKAMEEKLKGLEARVAALEAAAKK
ncbi:Hypp4604 [Branchiostoma lanceolatum]|uniref:Hypp4604 protein n=1 Tax=Branchiostoma lanceolatum TaxID=7740 RepID=A0A8K0F1J2_BRALA|nr:Hypp4604 [Branchiostoma lanceolatum]